MKFIPLRNFYQNTLGAIVGSISIVGLCCQTSHAALTLYWQSEVSGVNFSSDGSTAWDSSYTAHVGVFNPSFTPTSTNTDDWLPNWNEIGSTQYSTTNNFFSSQIELPTGYNSTYTFASGGALTSIPANIQIYIWVQNVGVPVGSQICSQWLLVKDTTWLVPAESTSGSQTNRALTLDLTSTNGGGVEVVLGGSSGVSPQQVGGTFTAPVAANWNFQTHEVKLIPEPSASLLTVLGVSVLMLRRSRNPNASVKVVFSV